MPNTALADHWYDSKKVEKISATECLDDGGHSLLDPRGKVTPLELRQDDAVDDIAAYRIGEYPLQPVAHFNTHSALFISDDQ